MPQLRNAAYAHGGDRVRRHRRLQRRFVALGLGVFFAVAWTGRAPGEANAESAAAADELMRLRAELHASRGELGLASAQLDRWSRIFAYSSRYNLRVDLATAVYDIALAEGIDPELGFRLVRAESEFNPRAKSVVGAIGLTQVMPSTARSFEKGITPESLYDENTNLRIGFRYLRTLLREQNGNVKLALLGYNRGPAAVAASRRLGIDPSNGYDRAIMRGYTGRGVAD